MVKLSFSSVFILLGWLILDNIVGKSLSYYALVNRNLAFGVAKKIDNTVLASSIIGVKSSSYFFDTNFKGVISFFSKLIVDKSDVIIIRFSDLVFPIVFFIMLYLRLRGRKIIIDVPTPRVVGLLEIDVLIKNPLLRFFRKVVSYVSSSWVLFPANLIVQYANESFWFRYGISKKMIKMGNGILVNQHCKLRCAVWPSTELKLVAVANVSDWHGYDRLLKALASFEDLGLPFKVCFDLIGDGDAIPHLKKLTQELGLNDRVNFLGSKTGSDLETILVNSHIGISSLGLYRKGLNEASDLKTREYMLHGLPVIGVGSDPDFSDSCDFRYTVTNDDGVDSIVALIKSFEFRRLNSADEIRAFAKSKLSLESKIERILKFIL